MISSNVFKAFLYMLCFYTRLQRKNTGVFFLNLYFPPHLSRQTKIPEIYLSSIIWYRSWHAALVINHIISRPIHLGTRAYTSIRPVNGYYYIGADHHKSCRSCTQNSLLFWYRWWGIKRFYTQFSVLAFTVRWPFKYIHFYFLTKFKNKHVQNNIDFD